MIDIKRVAEKWKIWDEEEKAAKSLAKNSQSECPQGKSGIMLLI